MKWSCAHKMAVGPSLALVASVMSGASGVSGGRAAADHVVRVFDSAPIGWSEDSPQMQPHDPYILRDRGQEVERTISLPLPPTNQRNARRIIARVTATPVQIDEGEQLRIADPWTRLGHVTVFVPATGGDEGDGEEIEIMRFITGFGGESTFERDVSAYGPLLTGNTILRTRLRTWTDPAWNVSLTLEYQDDPPGYRRPAFVAPLITEGYFTSSAPKQKFTLDIPLGLSQPRLHVYSTGHGGDQEFASATHIVLVDNREVARWRPWKEESPPLHDANPLSERWEIDGRELWSSDIDRAGWMPGSIVDPFIIPLPELSPGTHSIELSLEGIRPMPADATEPLQGPFWMVSATVVADDPWPAAPPNEETDDSEGGGSGGGDRRRMTVRIAVGSVVAFACLLNSGCNTPRAGGNPEDTPVERPDSALDRAEWIALPPVSSVISSNENSARAAQHAVAETTPRIDHDGSWSQVRLFQVLFGEAFELAHSHKLWSPHMGLLPPDSAPASMRSRAFYLGVLAGVVEKSPSLAWLDPRDVEADAELVHPDTGESGALLTVNLLKFDTARGIARAEISVIEISGREIGRTVDARWSGRDWQLTIQPMIWTR